MIKKLQVLLVVALLVLSLASFSRTAQAAMLDPLNDGGFEQVGNGADKAYDWQDFGGGYTRVAGGHTGQFSMRLQNATQNAMAGGYQRVDFHQSVQKPVFIGAYVKGSNVNMVNGSYFGASIYAEIHMMDGRTLYWNTIANSGTFDWRWVGFNTGSVSFINGPIDYIFVVPALINASGTAWFDDVTVADFEPTQAAVTLMFDDGPANTFTAAKPAMDVYGFKGVSGIITSYTDQDTTYMTSTQIQALYTSGWEIASHSVNHTDMTTITPAQAVTELEASKAALAKWSPKLFATPYGAYNAYILGEGAKYYTTMRNFEQGSNPQGTFPYDVKVRGITTQTTMADIQNWLAEAQAQKRWEVFVFHDIANTGDDIYHTPVAQFKQILQSISASGVPVKTYSDALQQFGVAR